MSKSNSSTDTPASAHIILSRKMNELVRDAVVTINKYRPANDQFTLQLGTDLRSAMADFDTLTVELARCNGGPQGQDADEMDAAQACTNRFQNTASAGFMMKRIDEAKKVLEIALAGRYGICADCEGLIDPERLEIFPLTTLCVPCKSKREAARR
jgi:RNA polymerase-binding transcription factor DksA